MSTTMHWRILILYVGMCTPLSFSREIPGEAIVIRPNCNSEAVLPCAAKSYSHAYTSIIWYKIYQSKEHGIIIHQRGESTPYSRYKGIVSLTKDYSLVLKNVTLEHAGMYKCHITAKVGEKNNNSQIMLNTSECITETTPAPVFTAPVLSFTHSASHGMNSSEISVIQPVEVTTLWAFVGVLTVGLTKVLLCALCVWAVVAFKKRRRRSLWS
ncbi:uncharacterized protein LOC118813425 isoform X2 [Colossoma macropomum]|uniref:uncharacterized protein LOC118813425 isoform X2 n=1 Tax=Colossoma macropomum TaxID=42526 RepID=UPI00186437A5|nr:uncharacterized protein LOC118813425 isoform X2 [Colossoma macropomum]